MIRDLGYWTQGFQARNAQIHVLLNFLQCVKVQFSATDGIMQNSVLKISFIHGVQATDPWILEMDEFHIFLAKYLDSNGSLDE